MSALSRKRTCCQISLNHFVVQYRLAVQYHLSGSPAPPYYSASFQKLLRFTAPCQVLFETFFSFFFVRFLRTNTPADTSLLRNHPQQAAFSKILLWFLLPQIRYFDILLYKLPIFFSFVKYFLIFFIFFSKTFSPVLGIRIL